MEALLKTAVSLLLLTFTFSNLSHCGFTYEFGCDDNQDPILWPCLNDARSLADTVLNAKLRDGTTFEQSTA
jgi:hypothetical protein